MLILWPLYELFQIKMKSMKNLIRNKDVLDLTHVLLLSIYLWQKIISFSYGSKSQINSCKPYLPFVYEYNSVYGIPCAHMRIPESILFAFHLCSLNKRDFASSSIFWMLSLASSLKHKVHMAMTVSILVPLSYTACSFNNMCTFHLLEHIYVFLSILLESIKCFYVCKWAYLVFPSIYSKLVYHWIYSC